MRAEFPRTAGFHVILMRALLLLFLILGLCAPSLGGGNDNDDPETEPDPDYGLNHIRFVSFGDSWSSGVNYGPPDPNLEVDFPDQDEICRCRRVKEAWPYQLALDLNNSTHSGTAPDWLHGRSIDLDYQACHGSFFDAIRPQIDRMNQTYAPDFGTITIGGNPGGFADILHSCVYQPEAKGRYGPEYPDPEGQCWKTLQWAKETIKSQSFLEGVLLAISRILTAPMIRKSPDFKLYVVSYATLFNDEDAACNDISFGYWSAHKPKLSRELRREINGIINTGRELYDRLFNGPLFAGQVRYVDIDPIFAGRRFCEPTTNGTLQQQNDKSWLYNFEWPSCIVYANSAGVEQPIEDGEVDESTWPTLCRKCGSGYGEFQRPFHPKPVAHLAMKDFVIQEISKTPPPPPPEKDADEMDGLHGDLR